MNSSLLEEALETWSWVRDQLIEEAENIPADRYDFRPTPDVRSVAEVVRHVLEFGEMMIGELNREDGDFRRQGWPEMMKEYGAPMAGLSTKQALVDALREQFERGTRRFRDNGELFALQAIYRFDRKPGTRLAWLIHGVEHESHHIGQITVYTRVMGLVPALTKKIEASA